jgi:DNA-binding GntR family transcriptional regulator
MPMERLTVQPQLMERAYDAILDEICTGRLAPEQRVTQDELAERLAVSRQPVLQALLLLKRQGFLRDAGRRGLMVAPLDPVFTAHVYELRSALDGAAARGAARRHTAASAGAARILLERGWGAVAAGDTAAVIAADIAFHRFLYELSGNPLITETATLHWHHIRRVMGQVLRDPARLNTIWDEHAGIIEAVLCGDAERAEALSRLHAERAAQALIAELTLSLQQAV